MKQLWLRIWNNKQAITGAVTSSVSLAAGAGLMTAEAAIKITAVTGIITLLLGVLYTLLTAKDAPVVNPAPETLR